jgi:ribosomal protein S18 acetylase RimI-like enzyme
MTFSPANRVLDAHIRYLRHLTSSGGGWITEETGYVGFCSPHPFPALVNVWARLDASASPDEGFASAEKFFASHERSAYEILGLVGRDEDLLNAAESRGLEVGAHPEPLQLLSSPLEAGAASAPPGATVRWIDDEQGAAAVTEVARLAHKVYGFPDDLFPTLFAAPEVLIAPDLGVLLVELDGRPVATAQMQTGTGTGYLGWVAVVPDLGRSGLGGFVTVAAIERAFESGCSEVALLASPMGAKLYRRLGFEDVGGLRSITVEPPTEA